MNEGVALLWATLIVTIGATASLAAFLSSGAGTYRRLARMLVLISFAMTTAVFLLVIFDFLTSNMSVAYVHANSRSDYPWYYKVAGAWAGDDGSILLWTWLLSLTTTLFFIDRKKDSMERARLRSLASVFLLIIVAAFLYLLTVADPFRPTAPMYLVTQGMMEGRGLSPLLLTPLVIIHPPLEFAAYALLAVPFASAMAHLALGKSQWTRVSMQWIRSSWLFLTLAIVIGALWAYTVLGWGGFWAWDPVETSNLAIWLPLTGLVHTSLLNRRKGRFPHLAPAFAAVSFALALLATFETRTGVIVSVHSFTGSSGARSTDLGGRLLSILDAGGAAPLFFMFMIISLLVAASLFMVYFERLRKREGKTTGVMAWVPLLFLAIFSTVTVWTIFDLRGVVETFFNLAGTLSIGFPAMGYMVLAGIFIGAPLIWMMATSPVEDTPVKGLRGWISDDGVMEVAMILFVLWTLVTLALMVIGANALNPSDFEGRLPFLLVPVCVVLFAGLTWRFFTSAWLPYVLIVLSFTVIMAYALMSSNLGALYLPLVFALVFAVGLRIYRVWAPALLSRRLRAAAMLNLIALLLAFVMWGANAAATGLPLVSSTVPISALMVIATTAAIMFLAFAVSKHDIRLWIVSGLLGIAMIGYLLGSILSIIAIILVLVSRKEFRQGARHRRISFTAILRGASPQLVHLGVALLVLGYAASSYYSVENNVTAYPGVDTARTSLGYTYRLAGSQGTDVDGDGLYEVINADFDVSSGGGQFSLALKMTWTTEGVNYAHYLSDPKIRAGPAGDLYYIFMGFGTATGEHSITDQPSPFSGAGPFKTDNVNLTTAWFQVKQNPLIPAFWSGGWLMATGIVVRMWSERSLYGRERVIEQLPPEEHSTPLPAAPSTEQRDEDYYRRLLEEEIRKGEDSK